MIESPSSEKLPCSSSQIDITPLLKSSFVFQRYIKPAAKAATIAMTASTGPGTALRAVVNPITAPFSFPNCATMEPHFIATITELMVPSAIPISGRCANAQSTAGATLEFTRSTASFMTGVNSSAIGCITSDLIVRPSCEKEPSSVS